MGRKRKNGEGTVRLRKDGRWEGRVVIGYDEKGLPKTKNVLAKTKGECVEKLKALKETVTPPTPAKVKTDMSFGDWLDTWYETLKDGFRPSTQRNYEQKIRLYIRPKLGGIPLNKLTVNDFQQFYIWLKTDGRSRDREIHGTGLSDGEVVCCRSLCSRVLDKAVEEGLIAKNPSRASKGPSRKRQEMSILSREDIQKLLIQAKCEGYYEVFLVELATGLRVGELMALQWDDLNMDTGELRINKQVQRIGQRFIVSEPKTKAAVRTIILPPSIVKVLAEYKETVDSRWMFPSPKIEDKPIDPSVIRLRLYKLLDHAGCRRVRFHDLRHTFATNALAGGMDVKTLSTIIGHVSSSTTLNVYAHATDAMKQEAAAKIDHGIAKAETMPQAKEAAEQHTMTDFHPTKGIKRKWGTGSVIQCSKNRWRGYFSKVWPDGTTRHKDVYTPTEEECEALLKEAMAEMKTAINAERERLKDEAKAS